MKIKIKIKKRYIAYLIILFEAIGIISISYFDNDRYDSMPKHVSESYYIEENYAEEMSSIIE